MNENVRAIVEDISKELAQLKEDGLFKEERVIESPQSSTISVNGNSVLNFCANNYLGLSNSEALKAAAIEGIRSHGLGLSSVRFICGTQDIHKALEEKISNFLGLEDAILYSSCFDANGGLFETLLSENDAIISDALNHASIIDGIRLCKAQRFRYEHSNLGELEEHLKVAKSKSLRRILIATDGVFSMDGDVARLAEISDLAQKYGAMLMVDDSHATGFFGPTGRGTIEACGVMGKVDIVTSTFGKALGGASGGFIASSKPVATLLRQRSRPYLFSNSLAPAIVAATIECLGMIDKSEDLLAKLQSNTKVFRQRMTELGFKTKGSEHPIVPIMLGDARLARDMAAKLLLEGIYVIGFSYPVVPKGEARIRVQISAGHSSEEIDLAIRAFEKVGKEFGVI